MGAVTALVVVGALASGIDATVARMELMDRGMKECRIEQMPSGRIIVWDRGHCAPERYRSIDPQGI